MVVIDMMGQRFGALVVVDRGPNELYRNQVHATWVCECECGERITVRGVYLRTDRGKKSCGCRKFVQPYRDLTGERFGRLVVVRRGESHRFPSGRAAIRWWCRCDCGGEKLVQVNRLTRGLTKSCGCMTRGESVEHRPEPVEEPEPETPSYLRAHQRVTERRGPAAFRKCVDCGKRAEFWVYNRKDPNELTGHGSGKRRHLSLTYSLSAFHYDPRCSLCRALFEQKMASRP